MRQLALRNACLPEPIQLFPVYPAQRDISSCATRKFQNLFLEYPALLRNVPHSHAPRAGSRMLPDATCLACATRHTALRHAQVPEPDFFSKFFSIQVS
ncbi:hypothetical protein A2U01_0048101 [Trifolium medium]|uniref:Uncharacterized protein n=1 Tax=Trifolium medium TaxID=97028 RepID=A0A392QR82_9FABA|nr:hypothetical protein [Trifolium medium]